MNISIIIVNYNTTNYVEQLINSIEKFLKNIINYEIIIVDNQSPDRSIEKLQRIYQNSSIKFIFLNKNYGFGYANNRGIEIAQNDYYLLLNPDTLFVDDSIKYLFNEFLRNNDWGIAGPKVLYMNGHVQETALHYPNIRYEIYSLFGILSYIIRITKKLRRFIFRNKPYKTDFLFGSCLLIRKEVHNKIQGFDEDYFLFSEETDYCYRVNKYTNFKVIYFPKATIYHKSGAITKKFPYKREWLGYNSKLIFINKHYSKPYSFFFRMAVIILFYKKILMLKFHKKYNKEALKYYKKIIKTYKTNKPLINNV